MVLWMPAWWMASPVSHDDGLVHPGSKDLIYLPVEDSKRQARKSSSRTVSRPFRCSRCTVMSFSLNYKPLRSRVLVCQHSVANIETLDLGWIETRICNDALVSHCHSCDGRRSERPCRGLWTGGVIDCPSCFSFCLPYLPPSLSVSLSLLPAFSLSCTTMPPDFRLVGWSPWSQHRVVDGYWLVGCPMLPPGTRPVIDLTIVSPEVVDDFNSQRGEIHGSVDQNLRHEMVHHVL